ncbi:helix-turn-helix transcriptional regulator [Knoellia sp. LjRoot47]|uniref:helix-turn-helix transcriptional regulator n=1 Tax=Knoellia sp. LjRoot47 TaxID=3342330 RepID=UPI003ED0B876
MNDKEAWKTIGNIVRWRRKQVGITQEQVAEYGGPGKTTMGKIENGRMEPFPAEAQQDLEKVLGWKFGRIRELHSLLMEFGEEIAEEEMAPEGAIEALPDLARLRREAQGAQAADALTGSDDVALIATLTARLARASQVETELAQLRIDLAEAQRAIRALQANPRKDTSDGPPTRDADVTSAQDDLAARRKVDPNDPKYADTASVEDVAGLAADVNSKPTRAHGDQRPPGED